MSGKKSKRATSSAGSKGKGKGKRSQSPAEMEMPGHPDDIFPMVLTSVTQELFGCTADEDVTGENPYKLLNKDDIIQDIKTRAAVSDFSPVKQTVLDYPEDEMLLVYDRDFTYDQCFYLVLTPEAKDKILKPPKPETPQMFENEVIKTPEPKPWISLGSEQEIEEESVKETREKLRIKFSRVLRKFGAPACFSDRNAADDYIECVSYQDSSVSIKLMERDCGVQAVPRLQSSTAQTEWRRKRNAWTQYEPRELSDEEKANILLSESLKGFMNLVTPRVLHALQQEEIANVFIDDFKALGTAAPQDDDSEKVSKNLILYQTFIDEQYTKDKKISSICWHPTIYGVIAVALMKQREAMLKKPARFSASPSFILFYNFSSSSDAQLLLECPEDIFAFEFCPSDPNIIVGGCRNGQVLLWDISDYVTHLQGAQPSGKQASVNTDTFAFNKETKTPVVRYSAASAIEHGHKAPVTDVQWLPPTFEVTRTGLPVENKDKISVQVVSCSPDCSLLFWDVRAQRRLTRSASDRKKTQATPVSAPDTFKHLDQTWRPLFKVSLPKINNSGEYAPLKFSLEHYTGNADNTEEVKAIPDYSQLRVPSAKNLTTLEDVNTKLYLGTEDGEIVYTDLKKEEDTSGQVQSSKPLYCFGVHTWLVTTVQRSPFFRNIILTTGGKHFAIWKEDVMDGPIIKSQMFEQDCSAGCWSLSRPAVFFIGKEDGTIEVWNLLEDSGQPVHIYHSVAHCQVTCIKPWIASTKQHFLAVTDEQARVQVLKIPKKLYTPSSTESLSIKKYFEQQEAWLKDFVRREKMWEKEMKEAEELKKKTEHEKPAKSLAEDYEPTVEDYHEFLALEEKALKSIGMWKGPRETKDT